MQIKDFRSALTSITLFLFAIGNPAFAQTPAAAPKTVPPSRKQMQQLNLDLQLSALKCEQQMKVIARELFDALVAIHLRRKNFADSYQELIQSSAKEERTPFPPTNPYADSSLVPKEIQLELAKSGDAPSARCRVLFERDPYINAAFPLTLNKVKLNPGSAAPGTIVVKCNGDYYLAVWCMGLDSKPITDEKTHLPFVLFKDFSTALE